MQYDIRDATMYINPLKIHCTTRICLTTLIFYIIVCVQACSPHAHVNVYDIQLYFLRKCQGREMIVKKIGKFNGEEELGLDTTIRTIYTFCPTTSFYTIKVGEV